MGRRRRSQSEGVLRRPRHLVAPSASPMAFGAASGCAGRRGTSGLDWPVRASPPTPTPRRCRASALLGGRRARSQTLRTRRWRGLPPSFAALQPSRRPRTIGHSLRGTSRSHLAAGGEDGADGRERLDSCRSMDCSPMGASVGAIADWSPMRVPRSRPPPSPRAPVAEELPVSALCTRLIASSVRTSARPSPPDRLLSGGRP